MAIEWKPTDRKLSDSDRLTITLTKFEDGVETKESVTETFHRTTVIGRIKISLAKKVKKIRQVESNIDSKVSVSDFSDFEDVIASLK